MLKSLISYEWFARLSPHQNTISFPAGNHLPQLRDFSKGLYPPKGLEAHAQVARHDPVALDTADKCVEPVQKISSITDSENLVDKINFYWSS